MQQLGIGGHWRAGDIDERWHDRRNPCSNRGGKWRQVNLVQCPLGHLRRGILTAGGNRAIGAQMLGGGGKAVRRCEIRSLEAAGLRRRHLGRDPGVLPGLSMMRPQRGSRATSSIGAKVRATPSSAASSAATRAVFSHRSGAN